MFYKELLYLIITVSYISDKTLGFRPKSNSASTIINIFSHPDALDGHGGRDGRFRKRYRKSGISEYGAAETTTGIPGEESSEELGEEGNTDNPDGKKDDKDGEVPPVDEPGEEGSPEDSPDDEVPPDGLPDVGKEGEGPPGEGDSVSKAHWDKYWNIFLSTIQNLQEKITSMVPETTEKPK